LKTEKHVMRSGLTINAIAGDLITERIKADGVYEVSLYRFLTEYLASIPDAVCADIGANIGNHSLTMALHAKETHAFEPVPFIYEILRQNKEDNNLESLNLHNLALGNENADIEMLIISDSNSGRSRISEKYEGQDYSKKIPAKVRKGDDFFKEADIHRLDLIKIDVEGHETQVILGLKNTIAKHKPIVIFEWNDPSTKQGFQEYQIFNTIFSGYSLYQLTDSQTYYRRLTDEKILRSFLRKLHSLTKANKICLRSISDLESNYGSLILIPDAKNKKYIFNQDKEKFLVV